MYQSYGEKDSTQIYIERLCISFVRSRLFLYRIYIRPATFIKQKNIGRDFTVCTAGKIGNTVHAHSVSTNVVKTSKRAHD